MVIAPPEVNRSRFLHSYKQLLRLLTNNNYQHKKLLFCVH